MDTEGIEETRRTGRNKRGIYVGRPVVKGWPLLLVKEASRGFTLNTKNENGGNEAAENTLYEEMVKWLS
jgi:hypothetical protein